jgi:hypothetical protein
MTVSSSVVDEQNFRAEGGDPASVGHAVPGGRNA